MGKSISSFESEPRISPKPVLAGFVILGQLLALAVQILSYPYEVVERVVSLFLLMCVLSAIGWLLVNWKPLIGRWFTVLVLIAAVHLASAWLDLPVVLTLVAVPTTLTVALIGLSAAMIIAVGESLFVAGFLKYTVAGLDSSVAAVALVAIWAMLGVMYTAYRPVRQLGRWVEEYFERAQYLLEEARDRRAELEQALESLANANRQLVLANERMVALRAIAEEAQRAKTAFVANVSHEFRTPLNMIIGLVELMVETPEIYAVVLSPKMRKDLETVQRNCEHLSNMINDVLDLTRMETGRLTLHRERVNLKEVIDSSVAAVRPLLEKKRLALQVAVPDDLPEVYCDHTRIEQVILNLLSNAARFTREGGITIEVARQDQQVLIRVKDTGSGISPEDAERIFEPFWQSTRRLWRDKGGSGLGLSISKRFVELHGGRMWLESELGAGASFFFTLPISSPIEHIVLPRHRIREDWVWRERAFRSNQAGCADRPLKPRLIICDETVTLYPRLVRYSDEIEFVDARDLTQVMRELQECPAHAVVLNAATSNGLWPLIEAVRQQAPETPIIGCSIPPQVERAVKSGALGYLIKPVTRIDLEQAIETVGKPVKRVLLVDDDPDVLQLFSRMLYVYDSALEVVTASSGKEALEELRRAPFDLMLLDIVMPDMDGWQVLKSMVQDIRIGSVPVFFVSAQDPANQPPASEFLLTTINRGLSLNKLLRCSLEISALLLEPERELDLVPV